MQLIWDRVCKERGLDGRTAGAIIRQFDSGDCVAFVGEQRYKSCRAYWIMEYEGQNVLVMIDQLNAIPKIVCTARRLEAFREELSDDLSR